MKLWMHGCLHKLYSGESNLDKSIYFVKTYLKTGHEVFTTVAESIPVTLKCFICLILSCFQNA